MAYITTHRTETLAHRATGVWGTLVEAYSNWRVYRRTLSELQDLSMRELSDLGINRTMIRGLAYEAAYGANK